MENSIPTVRAFVTLGGNTAVLDCLFGQMIYHYFSPEGKHLRSEKAWYAPQKQQDMLLLKQDFQLPEIFAIYGYFGAIKDLVIDQVTIFNGEIISYHSEDIIWGRKSSDFKEFKAYED